MDMDNGPLDQLTLLYKQVVSHFHDDFQRVY